MSRRLPEDHPARFALMNELHARPYPRIAAPARVSHIAVQIGETPAARAAARAHLAELCAREGAGPPPDDAAHYAADLGRFSVKWELHTEFAALTLIAPADPGAPLFQGGAVDLTPDGWLAAAPGRVIAATHVEVLRGDPALNAQPPVDRFAAESLAGALVSDGAARVHTDFRLHGDGFSRYQMTIDRRVTPRRAGRIVQRLCEIDTYRAMAMLALPEARRATPQLTALESELVALMGAFGAFGDQDAESDALERLTRLSVEVEHLSNANAFRFSAARAYWRLVEERLAELRESRIEGLQSPKEFLQRRFVPAMRTIEAVERRQDRLAQRLSRASNLLRTRVDVAVEAQNRDLLRSMDRRARLQLRLQETVEGLSVAAISYYGLGLLHYVFAVVEKAAPALSAKVMTGIAAPVVVGGVWLALRRLRKRLARDHGED